VKFPSREVFVKFSLTIFSWFSPRLTCSNPQDILGEYH
jgi:hypothetical protein